MSGVAFSPDGVRLASVGYDKTLRLWDARSGQKQMFIRAHSDRVIGVEFNNVGTRLASVSLDGTFKLWDVEAGREIVSLPCFTNSESQQAYCIAFSPNDAYVTFGGTDHKVKLLDGRTGQEIKSFQGHDSSICGVAFAPDSKRLVSGSLDQTVKLWDIESGKEITTLGGLTGEVIGMAFSPDGTRVAVCDDLTINLWDPQLGQVLTSLDGHGRTIHDVKYSPDGSRIASASEDNTIRVWDSRSGKELIQMRGHTAGVVGIAYSPDGKRIASTSFDSALKLWDTQTGIETITIEENAHGKRSPDGSEAHSFQCAVFSPDGLRIAAGTDNGIIKFLSAPIGHEFAALNGHTSTVTQFSFSGDGNQIYSESANEKFVWDVATGKQIENAEWSLPVQRRPVSSDGRWFVTSEFNHVLLVDREFRNTPHEKAYRAERARFDPAWHQEQATAATTAKNWYAATFHFALLMKYDPNQTSYLNGLQSSFQELKSQFEQQEIDLEPHLASVVKEFLNLPRGYESANLSFEEPEVRQGSFELREAMPGWKTTGTMFEIWSTGFLGVNAYDGKQFVELNAIEDATLYRDSIGIERDAEIEFSFAHRGRNGNDKLKLKITDLGADNVDGGGDDLELFTKEYTTGKDAWAVYDSTTEPAITALGNQIRFSYIAVYGTGGKGPDKTEGNFLDAAEFGVGVVTAKRKAYGIRKLEAFIDGGDNSESRYLGMSENRIGIPVETESRAESIFVLKIEKNDQFAVLTDTSGKYLTAQGDAVVVTDTLEPGSRWVIRNPLKTNLNPNDGWFSLESANDPGRFLRHYSLFVYAHKKSELTAGQASLFLSDASWKFVDAQ